MSGTKTSFELPAANLTAKLNTRTINQALLSEDALQASFIGQQRAKKALEFGLGMQQVGYNLYVMGDQATGRYTLVKDYIARHVAAQTTPHDWCYLNNFDEEREPIALKLKASEAKRFQKDMEGFVDELLDTFPAAFEHPGFQRQKAIVSRSFEEKYEQALDAVESYAQEHDVALYEENNSISFAPIVDGKPLNDEEFSKLSDQQRQFFYDLINELEERLSESLLALPTWKRESSEQLRKLHKTTASEGVKPLIKALEHKYVGNLAILKYFRQMKDALVELIVDMVQEESKEEKTDETDRRAIFEEQFLPNVLVSREVDAGVPIVYEPNPTFQNLFGKLEYTNIHGSVYTNHRMIRPGALLKANDGYLILDIDQVLSQPYVWESLKLALKANKLILDPPHQDVGMVNSMTLQPQPIELQVKVILLGSRSLYYSLQEADPEFDELFRVLVDFDSEIPVTKQTLTDFVGRVRVHCSKVGFDSIATTAMHRLVEYSLRHAEHQQRLSAHFADVLELVNEASYFARQSHSTELTLAHLNSAIKAKKERTGRVSHALLNDIKQGQVLIDTSGSAIGKVNGLTVLQIGDTAFGTPARITATVYAGSSGVVDIEREVELGQSIHSKGVLLLTGYLGHKYAQKFPLTLSANIALEQSYGYIDGDSASLAELVALISAITEIPCCQSLAITGSINQYGEVQAVGGVNEKIEGYFELCKYRGLNGQQGVIIPRSNAVNLVLDKSLINAVKRGQFHIYTASKVDDALEILMQSEAGTLDADRNYPISSINGLAMKRLADISAVVNGSGDDSPDEESEPAAV